MIIPNDMMNVNLEATTNTIVEGTKGVVESKKLSDSL